MSFSKKHRIVIGIGIVVLTIGTFIFLYDRTPPEPVVIYKATEPAPRKIQKNVDTSTNHAHSHDTTAHTHTPEASPSEDSYDWGDNNGFDSLRPKTDPWKQIYVSDDPAPAPTDDETDPPPDLQSTEDPKLRAKYL